MSGQSLKQKTIREFAEKQQQEHDSVYGNGSADVAKPLLYWNEIFEREGFWYVDVKTDRWSEIHSWMVKNVHRNNYTWVGTKFWFDDPEIASWVALKWT